MVTFIYSVMITAVGGLLAYGGTGGMRTPGIVLVCGALLVLGEIVVTSMAGRHEERLYRTYDGP